MKKLLILSITLFSLFSCSSDDENIEKDPLIGTWYFFSENGKEVDDCNKKSTAIISEKGDFTATNYGNQDNPNACVIENINNGTWVSKKNNKYELKNNKSGSITIHTITFSDNKNTFKSEVIVDNTKEIATFKRK